MACGESQENKLGLPQSLLLVFPPQLCFPAWKSGFAAVCVNKIWLVLLPHPKGLWVLLHPPEVCGPLGMNQQGLPQEAATFQAERKRQFLGQCGAPRPPLRACLEGTCEKHKLLGSQEMLGEFCAFESTELSLDSFVLPNTVPLCCGSP